jgi:hypothetical protein
MLSAPIHGKYLGEYLAIHPRHNRKEAKETNTTKIWDTRQEIKKNLSQEQIKTPNEHYNFYPRVVNNTNIPFTKNETTLLGKGLKYNLHNKKNLLTILALEAETAISSLPITDREYYRKKVSDHKEKQTPKKLRPQSQ